MASYTLHIQYVDRPAETRTITQPKLIIGRDVGDIVLHDSQVSGRHAEITWDGATLRFTDLGSTNGSFLLQGQRVANLDLTPGIALRVGNSLITVQSIDGMASSAGKGRTVIAAPGMVPGFPAPVKPGTPRPPGPVMPAPPAPAGAPPPGNFAFAPTAQHQGPLLRPAPQAGPAPGGAPGGVPFAGAPPQPVPAAAPFPAPQPPGPPPGAPGAFGAATPATGGFAGPPAPTPMPQSAIATPPPQELPAPPPAAAPVAGPPVLVPEPAAPAPAPAPEAAAPPAGEPAGGDLVAQAKFILGESWKVLQPVAAPAIATVAAITIPLGLLGQLGLMILPLTIASLLAMLLALAQLAAMVILVPSVARFVLGSYLGQPIPIQAAVQQSVQKAADVALNCFVPCIPLGIFAAPIYYVEDKKLGAVIGRNFNLLGKELVPLLVSAIGGGFAVSLGLWIVGLIFGVLPFGGILYSILVNGVMAFMTAFATALGVWAYFWVRRKHEGGDPEGEARARLGAAAGALPDA